MHNFFRVIRLALRHRLTVIAAVICSVFVAVLWAGNIAAVLPIVDGVMNGKSIPDLVRQEIVDTETQIAKLDGEISTFIEQLEEGGKGGSARLVSQIKQLEDSRAKRHKWLARCRYFLPVADRWLPMTPFGTLVAICVALLVSTMLKSLFRIAGMFFMARLGHLTSFELRKQFYRRTLSLDIGTFRQTGVGDLMNRFTSDITLIAFGTNVLFGMAILEPLKMVTCLIGAAWISWQLLLFTVIAAPLAGYAVHWMAKSLKRANRRAIQELSTVYDHLEETFGAIKVIKAFTMESRERRRFHQASKQYYRRSMKIAFYDSLVSPVTESMGVAVLVGVIMAGGYLVLNEKTILFGIRVSNEPLSHGMLTMFYGMLLGVIDPFRRLSGVFNHLQRAAAASDHVYELLDRTSQVIDPPTPISLPNRLGSIEFREVSFAYQPGELVLDGVSLQVEPGETIAIVGPNGCGKSTLMNLVPRFFDPTQGKVMLGGINLSDTRLRELRTRIGLVSQETILLDESVANNIRYGSVSATDQQVEFAARQAHAHGFITKKLANGYDTLCGPHGNRLSGGQRQRITLARAILRDPQILILDEATSQIDVESERLIHEVLESFVRDRTVFIITHRPSTLALAERIVVMDHGRVVDVGTSDELSARCELYQRLTHLEYRESA